MSWFALGADGIPLLIIFLSMTVKNLLNFRLQQSKNFHQFLEDLKFQSSSMSMFTLNSLSFYAIRKTAWLLTFMFIFKIFKIVAKA